MKLFSYQDRGLVLLCWAFNRGHAAKQVAKYVEAKGQSFSKTCPLEEIKVPESDAKGSIHILRGYEDHADPHA